MLYLHLTQQRAKNMGLNLGDAVQTTESHWLDHWFITHLDIPTHLANLFVFMNADTKYVMLFDDLEHKTIEAVMPVFIERLERFSGYNLKERYQDFQFCENEAAFEMGILNDLSYRVIKKSETMKSLNIERIECLWNQDTIHNQCPFDTLMGLLQDGVDIPHKDTSVPFLKIVR